MKMVLSELPVLPSTEPYWTKELNDRVPCLTYSPDEFPALSSIEIDFQKLVPEAMSLTGNGFAMCSTRAKTWHSLPSLNCVWYVKVLALEVTAVDLQLFQLAAWMSFPGDEKENLIYPRPPLSMGYAATIDGLNSAPAILNRWLEEADELAQRRYRELCEETDAQQSAFLKMISEPRPEGIMSRVRRMFGK